MNTLIRCIKASWITLWRNRLNAIATMVVMAIMLLLLNTLLVINFIAKSGLHELSQKIDLIVYLQNDVDAQKAADVRDFIAKQPGVRSATYITKEAALERFLKVHPDTADYYKKFNLENTLPASINVAIDEPRVYGTVLQALRESPYQSVIEREEPQQASTIGSSVVNTVQKIDRLARNLLFWVLAIFLIGGILILNNEISIAIYRRRLEIGVMQLVGATPGYIRLPYLLEAVWITAASILVSFGLLFITTQTNLFPDIQTIVDTIDMPVMSLAIIEALAAIALALISSYVAISKQLRRHMVLS